MSRPSLLIRKTLIPAIAVMLIMLFCTSSAYADEHYSIHLKYTNVDAETVSGYLLEDSLNDGFVVENEIPTYLLNYYGEEGLGASAEIEKVVVNGTELTIPQENKEKYTFENIEGVDGALYTERRGTTFRIIFAHNEVNPMGEYEIVYCKLSRDLDIEIVFKAQHYKVNLKYTNVDAETVRGYLLEDSLYDGFVVENEIPTYLLNYYGEEGLGASAEIEKVVVNGTELTIPQENKEKYTFENIEGVDGALYTERRGTTFRIIFAHNEVNPMGEYEIVYCKLSRDLDIEIVFKMPHTHSIQIIDKVEATCTDSGTEAYWKCSDPECGKMFSDEAATVEITEPVAIPAKGHSLQKTEAKAATYTAVGNSEYYTCSVCGKYFSDAEGTNEIAKDSWVIAKLAKKAQTIKVSAKKITLKAKNLKKKAQTLVAKKVFTVKNAKGKVTYKVAAYDKKAKKKITVSKAGKLTVKKGLKKGTYKVKVTVSAAETAEYKAGSASATVKVVVK